jgi:hypothetical protein
MDDETDDEMDDGTDGWMEKASRRPLLYVIIYYPKLFSTWLPCWRPQLTSTLVHYEGWMVSGQEPVFC